MTSRAFERWMAEPGPKFTSEDDLAWEVWQASRAQALSEAYDLMFSIRGDKVTRFDAQSAIRNLAAPEDVHAWTALGRVIKGTTP